MNDRLKRIQEPAAVALCLVVLGILVLAPLFVPAVGILAGGPETLAAALAPLFHPGPWRLLARSVLISTAATAGALLVGVPFGTLLACFEVPVRRAWLLLHVFPLFLPPFLLGLGWFHLLGRRGTLGSEATAAVLFSDWGVVLVLALTFAPIATVFTMLGLESVDVSMVEAGRVVASPLSVVRRLLLPLARPAIGLAALVVFSLSTSELGVPMLLRVKVYPAMVFTRLGGIDFAPGEAFALVLPLLGITALVLAAERALSQRASFATSGMRGAPRARLPLGAARIPVLLGASLVVILSVLPIGVLAGRALAGDGFSQIDRWLGRAIPNTLIPGALAAIVAASLGLVGGHTLARRRPGAAALDAIAVLGFVTPAAVLGVGLIAIWNRPATAWVYRGTAIFVLGYLARYAVIGLRTTALAISATPESLESAAATCGATYTARLRRIVAPLHRGGLALAALLAMLFAMRDLETAILFYPPGLEPLAVRIFTLESNGPEAVVAALAIVHVLLTGLVAAVGLAVVERQGRWS